MILLTLGTHEQPFERAVDLVTPLAVNHDVVVQHGCTPPRSAPAAIQWVEFMPSEELRSLMTSASSVVCHAGVGTIMTALGTGKTPVVVPRLAHLGEHVDDHQLQIADEFERLGFIVACREDDKLEEAIARTSKLRAAFSGRGELRAAVAAAVG